MSAPIIAPPLAGRVIASIGDALVIAEGQDAGALRFQVCQDEIEAGTGSSVIVPGERSLPYWDAGPGRVRHLRVMTSNIYRLIGEIHMMAERRPAALRA